MPTVFVYSTFAIITTLNSLGQLAPVPKEDLPSGVTGPIMFNESACQWARGKMEHPEKYVCQVFTGPTETKLVYQTPGFVMPVEAATPPPSPPPPERKSSLPDVQVGPTKLESKDRPTPGVSAETPKESPKQRKVAQQQPRYERQAMFEGNPISGLFNW